MINLLCILSDTSSDASSKCVYLAMKRNVSMVALLLRWVAPAYNARDTSLVAKTVYRPVFFFAGRTAYGRNGNSPDQDTDRRINPAHKINA